jgi:hypothetical protein
MSISFSNETGASEDDIREAARIGENYFQTENDPRQFRVNYENYSYVYRHFPNCLNVIKDENRVVGFALILPCNRKIMDDFLSKKINEFQLLELVKKEIVYEKFETVYLADAFIDPEYRRKGLILSGFVDSIKKLMKINGNIQLFSWGYSKEGEKLAYRIGEKLEMKVHNITL